jgi:hypothetical protein
MFGSISRVLRVVTARQTVPAIVLVIGFTLPTDSTRRVGPGGVLPLPIPEMIGDIAPLALQLEPLRDARHDARAERGRVLYAAGRAPAARTTAPDRSVRPTKPCPSAAARQALVQGRTTGAAPNS